MSKCVTYYEQTDKIDEFVECFGVTLEQLTTSDKSVLRAILAYWAYKSQFDDVKCTLYDVFTYFVTQDLSDNHLRVKKALSILEGITNSEVEGLLECLTAQLRWS